MGAASGGPSNQDFAPDRRGRTEFLTEDARTLDSARWKQVTSAAGPSTSGRMARLASGNCRQQVRHGREEIVSTQADVEHRTTSSADIANRANLAGDSLRSGFLGKVPRHGRR